MRATTQRLLSVFMLSLLTAASAYAGELTVRLQDEKFEPVRSAIVSLKPLFETDFKLGTGEKPEMRQEGALFAPFVLPVEKNTTVSFPNLDEFRHHVYSFSKAKRFELRLYGQDESKQIEFDTVGAVALGCNIHDNMLAYIYVTDKPVYGKSDTAGSVRFEGLPSGDYEVYVWHPDLRGKAEESLQTLTVSDESSNVVINLSLRKLRKKQLPPAEDTYN